jgi:hypothetical protein
MNFEKFRKLKVAFYCVLLLAGVGVSAVAVVVEPVYATTIDLTPIMDMIPAIVSLMTVSIVFGYLRKIGKV